MVHLLLILIYFGFISLGLPDSALGAAWPTMFGELNVPVSYAGVLSMIIAAGTIISSLCSDFLTKKLGTGLITALSVATTAAALLGFSFCTEFWLLCLVAIPYGLGAGSVDAALNNYVALHYASKHMSWLHCMWGVGTIIGPTIMGALLTGGKHWTDGYRTLSFIQIALTAILFTSLPLWKKRTGTPTPQAQTESTRKSHSIFSALKIPGAIAVMVTFFCYCALEQTAMLWSSSYMALYNGVPEDVAALCASVFFIGITVGRAANGFLTIKLSDTRLIRIGQAIILVGCAVLFLPFGQVSTLIGIVLVGLGCAPIYPCIIHSTPERFGAENSQALIGLEMACAYTGSCFMPPLFGLIANHVSIALFPAFLIVFLALMIVMHEVLIKRTKKQPTV